jgi:two-component sensor histidine kinase
MYQQLDSETVNTEVHLRGLLQKLARSLTKRAITVDTDIAAFEVTIHQAIPLGLIVNELFTNALKHAFRKPSVDDVIVVRLWLEADDQVVLELADNGVGLSVDFDANQDTLGMTIIQSLVGQLGGEWSLTKGAVGGSVARVRFTKGKLAKENGQL